MAKKVLANAPWGRATLAELAKGLVLTDRRVRQLVDQGVLAGPTRRRYDVLGCVRAYVQFLRRSPDLTDGTLEHARRRKTQAEAELAEMQLGRERGELLTVSYTEAQLSAVCERIRSRLLNIPGKYAPQMLGIHTIVEAQLRLEAAVGEAMAELMTVGEDPELDDDDDVANGEGGVAA